MGNGCCCCCRPKSGYRAVSPERKSPTLLASQRPSSEIVVPEKASQYKAEENPNKPRFGDLSISKQNTAKLIEGYEKEPVVSLEEALEPFHGEIDQLPERIKEAKTKCYYPSKHQLTRDESAAIYINSMNWNKTCVYDKLQKALKSGNQAEAKRWFKFLKLYKSALDKLPEAKDNVWQGAAYDEQKKKLLTSDDQTLYVGMGSCSPSDKALKKQLEKDGIGKKILVGYGPFVKAKDVTGYTAGDQEEFVIFPGSKVAKADVESDPDGTLYTHFTKKFKKVVPATSPKVVPAASPRVVSIQKHFKCPYKSCRSTCPADHDGSHCHTFDVLSHNCRQHCYPSCYTCDECKQFTRKIFQCHKCGTGSCEKCCFK